MIAFDYPPSTATAECTCYDTSTVTGLGGCRALFHRLPPHKEAELNLNRQQRRKKAALDRRKTI